MNICVFCGSSLGSNPIYEAVTRSFAKSLINANCTLVYGGGNIGLMGVLADEILEADGKVIGVIPDFLMQKEVGHSSLTQLEIVKSMHERKKRMADLSDAFVALPGGWGTLDELAEILTWKQLGLVNKPIGLLNVNSYFTSLIDQMKRMTEDGFLDRSHLDAFIIEKIPQKLLSKLGIPTV